MIALSNLADSWEVANTFTFWNHKNFLCLIKFWMILNPQVYFVSTSWLIKPLLVSFASIWKDSNSLVKLNKDCFPSSTALFCLL